MHHRRRHIRHFQGGNGASRFDKVLAVGCTLLAYACFVLSVLTIGKLGTCPHRLDILMTVHSLILLTTPGVILYSQLFDAAYYELEEKIVFGAIVFMLNLPVYLPLFAVVIKVQQDCSKVVGLPILVFYWIYSTLGFLLLAFLVCVISFLMIMRGTHQFASYRRYKLNKAEVDSLHRSIHLISTGRKLQAGEVLKVLLRSGKLMRNGYLHPWEILFILTFASIKFCDAKTLPPPPQHPAQPPAPGRQPTEEEEPVRQGSHRSMPADLLEQPPRRLQRAGSIPAARQPEGAEPMMPGLRPLPRPPRMPRLHLDDEPPEELETVIIQSLPPGCCIMCGQKLHPVDLVFQMECCGSFAHIYCMARYMSASNICPSCTKANLNDSAFARILAAIVALEKSKPLDNK